jgi:hypothetical protein
MELPQRKPFFAIYPVAAERVSALDADFPLVPAIGFR